MGALPSRIVLATLGIGLLTACGNSGFDSLGGNSGPANASEQVTPLPDDDRETLFDLFQDSEDPNTTVRVNKYIWNASLDVLDFMPIEDVDPFSGVIVMGYGRAPGSGRSYRATVFVQDPALDARSLRVALATQSGPADPDTVRAVEDAILTRARQLRLQDSNL